MAEQNLKLSLLIDERSAQDPDIQALRKANGFVTPQECDVIVCVGGDGFMLHTLHQALRLNKPVFGLNKGSVGFLMNAFSTQNLHERIVQSQTLEISPLKMTVKHCQGGSETYHAFNEVSLLRQLHQAAKIRVHVDGVVRIPELVCDGIIVATPVGSTAYNFSASGPILPLTSNLLALTPISPYRPRRWRGALLPQDVHISFEVNEPDKRPISATADYQEARDVCWVDIIMDQTQKVSVLYDSGQTLTQRVIAEQFEI